MPEAMVMEAISTMDYGYGVDIEEIYEYIEVNIYRTISLYIIILHLSPKKKSYLVISL